VRRRNNGGNTHINNQNISEKHESIVQQPLINGVFQDSRKKANIMPNKKPSTENSKEDTKYCPISFLKFGGKLHQKVLINRINNHIFSTEILNKNSAVSFHKRAQSTLL